MAACRSDDARLGLEAEDLLKMIEQYAPSDAAKKGSKMTSIVSARNVSKRYGSTLAVDDVSLISKKDGSWA